MALSRVVSEIFNVEKCRDLDIWVIGHLRSLKVVPLDRACMVSYILMMGLPDGPKSFRICLVVLIQYRL